MIELIAFEPRLLAGPDPRLGAEPFQDHVRRLGPLPPTAGLVETLERSALGGRGGAGFPVGTKWRSIAERPGGGSAVVLANGCEGEPLSRKDRFLMTTRPHLVLDGAFLAQRALGADRVLLLVAGDLGRAHAAMAVALAERTEDERRSVQLIAAPARYVTGESSAATNLANTGISVPTNVPPRPHQRGVDGAPTLVQNVESLAHVALIARRGDGWFRSAGRGSAAGTFLATIHTGAGPIVREVEAGTPLGEALEASGCSLSETRAVLLGGYYGSWMPAADAWGLPLDGPTLRALGLSLGAAVVAGLPLAGCVVCETAVVLRYLAGESSAQCGPCFFGLRAIADACERIQAGRPVAGELERLRRWVGEIPGRGACHHPDGATGFLRSALARFGADFEHHQPHRRIGALA
jgi:NADH:ubiquinone oxidoreductase subunit F (NADH-binding)